MLLKDCTVGILEPHMAYKIIFKKLHSILTNKKSLVKKNTNKYQIDDFLIGKK